ncbi:MAG: hypothetical protein HC860_16855 [Alkalinema sp. RU_4_3]|nr:hypothetical protein [Alkalinema sp. RU_4_3]
MNGPQKPRIPDRVWIYCALVDRSTLSWKMLNLNPRAAFQLGNCTEGFPGYPDQLSRYAESQH